MKKIVGPIRVVCGASGGDIEFPLPPSPGGRACKVVQYMAKISQFGGSGPKLGMKINHGPDGTVNATHTSIASAAVPVTNLYVFDSDGTKILGEFLHPILVVGGAATGDSLVVEVYEMRKPF